MREKRSDWEVRDIPIARAQRKKEKEANRWFLVEEKTLQNPSRQDQETLLSLLSDASLSLRLGDGPKPGMNGLVDCVYAWRDDVEDEDGGGWRYDMYADGDGA